MYDVIRRLPYKGVLEAYVYRYISSYKKACEIKEWYENRHKDDEISVALYIKPNNFKFV